MDDKIRDAFASIKANDEIRSSTKQYLQNERIKRSKKISSPTVWKWVAAVCAAVILLIGFGGYYSISKTPVSYISIDVNPSIELALNKWDKVISATAYNDDGSMILKTVSVEGMIYTDAINTIVESEAMKPYLTETASLTFTVACDDSAKTDSLETGIRSCAGCQEHSEQSYTTGVSTVQEAHESGLSFGKYSAYLTLSQYDDKITAKDCKGMTMKEIHDLISKYEGEGDHSGKGQGSGTCSSDNESGCTATDDGKSGNGKQKHYGSGEDE